MPESETELIDYFPPGWTEQFHESLYVEWVYDNDETIFVRVDGTMGEDYWEVTPVTGVNEDGEEFVTRPISGLSEDTAFDVAQTLIYAINGAVGRTQGEPEFTGGKQD